MTRLAVLFLVWIAALLAGGLTLLNTSIAADPPKIAADGAPQVATDDDVLKELRRLGAKVARDAKTTDKASETVAIELLHDNWQGSSENFKLLSRIPNLDRLGIFGVPVTDDDLKQLDGLKHLDRVELFGTKVTADGVARLRGMHSGIVVDRRGTAKLGLAGESNSAGVKIVVVQEGSAAAKAGIVAGDIIVAIDGEEVTEFERLVKQIGAHDAGDKVTLELHRGDDTLKKEVTLGSWR